MPSGWKKSVCQDCVDILMKSAMVPVFKNFLDSMRKMKQTLRSFKSWDQDPGAEPVPSTSGTSSKGTRQSGHLLTHVPQVQGVLEELGELSYSVAESEEGEIIEDRSSKIQRFLFPLDETEEFLKAI